MSILLLCLPQYPQNLNHQDLQTLHKVLAMTVEIRPEYFLKGLKHLRKPMSTIRKMTAR